MFCQSLCLLACAAALPQDPPPVAKPARPREAPVVTVLQLERALQGAQRKARHAELELALSELKSGDEVSRAQLAISDKEHARDAAARTLALYEEFEAPAAIEAADLSVDRAKSRLISERQDLEGILRIYAEEQEARSKDEIIRRHEVSVKFAERELESATKRLEKAKTEVEATQRVKAWAVEKVGRELELAVRAEHRAKLSAQLAGLKGRDAVTTAQEAIEEAERKLAKKTAEAPEEEK